MPHKGRGGSSKNLNNIVKFESKIRRMRDASYGSDRSIEGSAKKALADILAQMFTKITRAAREMADREGVKTIRGVDVKFATKELLGREQSSASGKELVKAGKKAAGESSDEDDDSDSKPSGNVFFANAAIKRGMRKIIGSKQKISKKAAMFMNGVLSQAGIDILNYTTGDLKPKKRVTSRALLANAKDSALGEMLSGDIGDSSKARGRKSSRKGKSKSKRRKSHSKPKSRVGRVSYDSDEETVSEYDSDSGSSLNSFIVDDEEEAEL